VASYEKIEVHGGDVRLQVKEIVGEEDARERPLVWRVEGDSSDWLGEVNGKSRRSSPGSEKRGNDDGCTLVSRG
jgi:hypothetical protein